MILEIIELRYLDKLFEFFNQALIGLFFLLIYQKVFKNVIRINPSI